MLFSIQQKVVAAVGFATVVSSAPANERSKLNLFERGVGLGWLCHYDGTAVAPVDTSLNLPLMIGGLCAKVNYEFDGCSSFKPSSNDNGDGGDPLSAQSAPEDDDSKRHHKHHIKPKHSNQHHKKPKHNGKHPDGSAGAQSFNAAGQNPGADGSSPTSHHKKPKHHGQDPNGNTGAQSFSESGDDDQPKIVGALGAGDGNSDECPPYEYYSSQLNQCMNESYFTQANGDSTCNSGQLDAVLNLCLDVSSILGITPPFHAESSVLPYGSGSAGSDSCPSGQQLSSLLNVCLDEQFFSSPVNANECQSGWKLDLVLGTCLDIIGCQSQGNN